MDDLHSLSLTVRDLHLVQIKGEGGSSSYRNPSSPVVLFLQRVTLAFEELPFSGMSSLMLEVDDYRASEEGDMGTQVHFSPLQASSWLEKRVEQFPQELGRTSGEELEEELACVGSCSQNPLFYYLLHLAKTAQGDVSGAAEQLRKYYDFLWLLQEKKKEPEKQRCDLQGIVPREIEGKDNLLPFCLLDLSSLHFRFGQFREAYLHVSECVKLSQESGNDVCLAFAMFWHSKIEYALRKISHKEFVQILSKIVNKANRLSLSELSLMSSMELRKQVLLSGASPRTLSSIVDELDSAHSSRWTPILGNSVLNEKDDLQQNFEQFSALNSAFEASSFRQWAKYDLSNTNMQVHLLTLQECSELSYFSVSDKVNAFSLLAQNHFERGENKLALNAFHSLLSQFPFLLASPHHSPLPLILQLFFHITLRKAFLHASQIYLHQFHSLASLNSRVDSPPSNCPEHSQQEKRFTPLYLSSLYCFALLDLKNGNDVAAAQKLSRLVQISARSVETLCEQPLYLIELARIYIERQDFVRALPYLLKCISLCEKKKFLRYLHVANLLMVYVKLHLQNVVEQKKELQREMLAVLPQIYENGVLYFSAISVEIIAGSLLHLSNVVKDQQEKNEYVQGKIL